LRDQKVVQGGASGDRSSSSAAPAPVARRAAESAASFVSAPCRFLTRQSRSSCQRCGAGRSGVSDLEVTFVKTYKGLPEKLLIPVARGCRWTRAW